MLYHLFDYIEKTYGLPGAGLFQFITFRAALTILTSLFISLLMGGRLIKFLRRQQVGETVRDLGLAGQKEKEGTPTMGGIIILSAMVIPTLLFADLTNVYIQLMLLVTVWMGFIGFLDDYIKVFKKNKAGLAGKFKIVGQVAVGLIVGATLFWSDDVVVREPITQESMEVLGIDQSEVYTVDGKEGYFHDSKGQVTTIPFVKNHEFNYAWLLRWMGNGHEKYVWLIFIPVVIFIVTAVSNGANITDGIDGLATGTSAIIGLTLLALAYVSGNVVLSEYLGVMYIPHSAELVVFTAAFMGACVGFLWYNSFPAQVFMGDTGSLALGGIIATLAIIIRKELLIPVLCGIFLAENLSVMMQVSYFKYTKKKYGEGRRIFKMSPLHHHYQKLGMHESKIVTRFWIVGIMLAILTIITLKVR